MINVIKHRKIPFIISAVLFVASVVLLFVLGLKSGIDFTGGSLIEVTFTGERPDISQVEEALTPLEFGSLLLQPSDDDAVQQARGLGDVRAGPRPCGRQTIPNRA